MTRFKSRAKKLSSHKFKEDCGGHLAYKMPELKNRAESKSLFMPNIILGLMIALTIGFSIAGYNIKGKYKNLKAAIDQELGSIDRAMMD